MTKKDFTLIAVTLNEWMRTSPSTRWHDAEDLAERFADKLSSGNPRFDRDRFVNAVLEGVHTGARR